MRYRVRRWKVGLLIAANHQGKNLDVMSWATSPYDELGHPLSQLGALPLLCSAGNSRIAVRAFPPVLT